jgi:uncharacterized protein YecE (DUF72 family)
MIRVGISGWTYPPWRGTFYPKDLPHNQELRYAADRLASIEINGTFYSLQRPASFATWRSQTPPGFQFAVKGGRFITHMKKLQDPQQSLSNFFASGVLGLADKLGPILWQLPPNLGYDRDRLADFFAALPRTQHEAAEIGARHDYRLTTEQVMLTPELPQHPIRHALEVRHDSFCTPELPELLRDHRIALVVADTAGRWPQIEELTADFGYIRLHGADELYVSGYTEQGLDAWASKISAWADDVSDIYVYFDNDVKVYSPYDALALSSRLTAQPPRSQ